jgi:hypothetical protein
MMDAESTNAAHCCEMLCAECVDDPGAASNIEAALQALEASLNAAACERGVW